MDNQDEKQCETTRRCWSLFSFSVYIANLFIPNAISSSRQSLPVPIRPVVLKYVCQK